MADVVARSETTAETRPEQSQRTRIIAFVIPAAHLTVLASFAIAQPLFDLLGKNAEFFAARASPPSDIVAFALAATFALPAVLVVVELAGGLINPAVRTAVHLVAVGFLAAVVALHAASNTSDARAAFLIPLALLLGSAFALAYHRVRAVRSFLTILTPAPFVFLGLFLFTGQIAKLILPGEASAATVVVRDPAPVVLVIFDEFPVVSLMDRQERIDEARYPNFAALADDSIWFRNTTSVSDFTNWAAPAILSGEYPEHDRLPIASDYPRSIFTLLGARYDIEAFMPFPQLCPRGLCTSQTEPASASRARSLLSDLSVVYGHLLLPKDLREKLPSVEGKWQGFRGGDQQPTQPTQRGERRVTKRDIGAALVASRDDRARVFERFTASLRTTRTQSLRVLHVLYPHYPWDHLPSGRYYDAAPRVVGMHRTEGSEFLDRQAWQRHLLQVGFTDRLIGEVVRRLENVGMYDDSLVIFTADHGASFRPGHHFRLFEEGSAPDIIFVPLFVKLPDEERAGTIEDRHVQTIDVLPTVADVLGIELPWELDGRSLLDGGTDRVHLLSKNGQVRTAPFEELAAKKRALVELQADVFGTGSERPGLFGVGPNSELVGRSAGGLPLAASGVVTAQFDRPDDLRSVDLDSAYVPALITGRISGAPAAERLELAISVNGRIVAVAESFRRSGEDNDRFSFVVPESAFRAGANEARVYRVLKAGSGIRALQQLACVGC